MSSLSISGKDAVLPDYSSRLSTSTAIQGKSADDLSMDDFMNLLVAQMTNQDIFNPTSDTEYVSQLATFSTLQGIQTIQEYQLSSYATSYVGKNVAIAYYADNGEITKTQGQVESVTFYDGDPKVIVNGVSYPLYSVMEVLHELKADTDADKDKTDAGDKTDGADKTDTDNSSDKK